MDFRYHSRYVMTPEASKRELAVHATLRDPLKMGDAQKLNGLENIWKRMGKVG